MTVLPSGGPRQEVNPTVAVSSRPRLRGRIHQYAFFVSLPVGGLVAFGAPSQTAALAVGSYAAAVSATLGVSAVYHRVTWTPARRTWMRRLDHSMIFILIAASYTAFAQLVLHGALARTILIAVWAAALTGATINLVWINAPKPVTALPYAAVGLLAAPTVPDLAQRLGAVAVSLILLAGLCSAVGAAVYALRRPNPVPGVFGYHEIFHALVVVSIAILYLVIAFFALPQTTLA